MNGSFRETEPSTTLSGELEQFRCYLLSTCGLSSSTRKCFTRYIHPFLVSNFKDGSIDLAKVTTEDIENFVMESAKRLKPVSLRVVRASLRSHLKFRALQGDAAEHLIVGLPVIANWRDADLPKSLTDEQLIRFLQAFDQSSPMGQRNYAIARCLVDLGLRGQEVANLCLESVDWRKGTLTISGGKGRRTQQLPLPWQTGEAVARYLLEGRPRSDNRALFVRHLAPYEKPITVSAVRQAMSQSLAVCGLHEHFSSIHVLRHTAATRLHRAGATLKEIADVLRHRDLDTTKIYTRVDLETLRTAALSWPGRQS